MMQEARSQLKRRVLAAFNFLQEELAVELADLLDVFEDDVLLATQRLRHVVVQDLGNVVVNDVAQCADVVALRLDELLHDKRQHPASDEGCVCCYRQ